MLTPCSLSTSTSLGCGLDLKGELNDTATVSTWLLKSGSVGSPYALHHTFADVGEVTGASRGLGRSVTETVLQNGDIVVATARSTSVFSDLTSKYPESQLLVLSLDVSNVDAIKAAFKAATDKFGRIDVVYNNAGAFTVGEAEAIPEADARKLFDVNFWAASNVALEAVRVLREVNKPQGGRIITIGSATGFAPLPGSNYYAASKFGE